MWSFGKVRAHLAEWFRNARKGSARVISNQDPASVLSADISENGRIAAEHDGQRLIDMASRMCTDVPL